MSIIIKCLGSGSLGNCWQLQSSTSKHSLLFDCGLTHNEILLGVENIREIDACLITHMHSDHCKSQKEIMRGGITCFDITSLKDNTMITIGNEWKILPMAVSHNVPCFAFLVENVIEHMSVCYITDTTTIPKIKKKLDCAIIECNYDDDEVNKNYNNIKNYGYLNHLSLEAVAAYLDGLENKPRNLIMAHMSNSGNINPTTAQNCLKKALCSDNVFIAKKKLMLVVEKQ